MSAIKEHTYNVDRQSGSLLVNGVPAPIGRGDVMTIESHAINVDGTTIQLPDGLAPTVTAGANIIVAGEMIVAFESRDDVVFVGTKINGGLNRHYIRQSSQRGE
jgi:hypothetical protein